MRHRTIDMVYRDFIKGGRAMIPQAVLYALYVLLTVALAVPLGFYIYKVMFEKRNPLSRIVGPIESATYKVLGIDPEKAMSGKSYLASLMLFSLLGFLVLFIMLLIQANYTSAGMDVAQAFNTAASFVTNTNWQSYVPENQMTPIVQALGLGVQNFFAPAAGMAVLFALIRGLIQTKTRTIGNFWKDMTRILLYILIPVNLVLSLLLVSQGVIQNTNTLQSAKLLEPIAVNAEGDRIENAVIDEQNQTVTVNGTIVPDARIVTKQALPSGLAASQIAIKQSGTNGGGYFQTNSAHPYENPTPISNFLEVISILLIPMALCFTFGRALHDQKQGRAVFWVMMIGLVLSISVIALGSHIGLDPSLVMEGKETRFGVAGTNIWTSFTTAASSGSVNSALESSSPLSAMTMLIAMQLGEVIFGGAGCGLYGMLAFLILTVFIAGLMVGRTPEFAGKKIEPYEMKWAVVMVLAAPFAILIGSTLACLNSATLESISSSGPHAFTQMLYAFTSAGANNGSAMSGFMAHTAWLDLLLGLIMLFARFVPMAAAILMAQHLSRKSCVAPTAGTLCTNNTLFVLLLVLIVVVIGALSFFPALALGPIAELIQTIH